MSTAIAIPQAQLDSIAENCVKSNLFGIKTREQALTLMALCQAEGLHPATAMRDYHLIQNRPAMKADAMLARFQKAGGVVEWQDYTDAKVSAHFSHPQSSPKPVLVEWTFEQAKRIGLTGKDNWQNYPRAMLRARLIAEGVRAIYPAAIGGMLVAEEARDMEPKDMGAAEVVSDAPKSKPANEKPALPELPAERLDAILKKFGPAIKAREFSPEEVIDDLEEKYTLTSEQISRIIDCQPALIEGEAA